MKRTVSDNSLSNARGEGKSELKFGGKSKGKLWPFIKKNKVLMAGPSVKWVLQSVETFTLSFSLKGTKILSLFQNAKKKKKKASVLFYFKTVSLFGDGTLAMATCLISDALSPAPCHPH